MTKVPLVTRYYTVIISKRTGKARAVCCQMDGCSSNPERADGAARSCNFFHSLAEAKEMAEEINQLFIKHAND